MLRFALWILEQENKAISWLVDEEKSRPVDVFALRVAMGVMTAPLWGMVAFQPYHQLYSWQAATSWAVEDITYTKAIRAKYGRTAARFRTYTYFNLYPGTRTFAMRSGGRFFLTKVASRALGPIGWALLAVDLWMIGKWIGDQTWSLSGIGVPEES